MKYQRRRLPEPGKALAAKLYGQMKQIERNKTMPVSKAFLEGILNAEATPDNEDAEQRAYTPRWDQEANPVIAGEVVSMTPIQNEYGEATRVIVKDEGPDALGEVSLVLGAVLRNQFKKLNIQPGHIIGIKHLGLQESSKGDTTFRNYVVKVQGSTAQKTLSAAKPAKAAPAEDDPFAGE